MERIKAIDLARGISVIMVIIVHTLWINGSLETQEATWLGEVIHFIGKGTGMFLIAMGVSFTLSRNQTLKLAVKRAVYILILGYSMNFLKFIVPILFNTVPDSFIEAYGWEKPLHFDQMMYLLRTGDILQLAGVSLLFIGLINKYSKNKYVPLLLALLVIAITKVVHGFQLNITGVDYLLDLLWGAEWDVYFAVFPWISFILVGMFFGRWYQEQKETITHLFSRMLLGGILLMLIGGGLCFYNYEYHFGDYFHLGPGGTLYLIGFNLVLLWLSNIIVTNTKHNKIFDFFYYCSKRVTFLYIIQWTIICWGMGLLGYQQFRVVGVLLLIPIYILLTLVIQRFALDQLLFSRKGIKNTKIKSKPSISV